MTKSSLVIPATAAVKLLSTQCFRFALLSLSPGGTQYYCRGRRHCTSATGGTLQVIHLFFNHILQSLGRTFYPKQPWKMPVWTHAICIVRCFCFRSAKYEKRKFIQIAAAPDLSLLTDQCGRGDFKISHLGKAGVKTAAPFCQTHTGGERLIAKRNSGWKRQTENTKMILWKKFKSFPKIAHNDFSWHIQSFLLIWQHQGI